MRLDGSGSFNNVYSSGTSCMGKGLLPGFDPKMVPPQFFNRVTEKGSSYCFRGPVWIQTTDDQTTVTFAEAVAQLSYTKMGIQLGAAVTAFGLTSLLMYAIFQFFLPENIDADKLVGGISVIGGITVALLTHHVAGKIFDRYL